MKRSVSRVEAFLRTPAGKALETSRYFQASLSWGLFERDDLCIDLMARRSPGGPLGWQITTL